MTYRTDLMERAARIMSGRSKRAKTLQRGKENRKKCCMPRRQRIQSGGYPSHGKWSLIKFYQCFHRCMHDAILLAYKGVDVGDGAVVPTVGAAAAVDKQFIRFTSLTWLGLEHSAPSAPFDPGRSLETKETPEEKLLLLDLSRSSFH